MAKVDNMKFSQGIGRRKTAIARVRIGSGSGQFTLNGEKVTAKAEWIKPLQLLGKLESSDVSIVTHGGGYASQDDAITLGIARALVDADAEVKPTLRKAGMVTVDSRVKERKKPGLRGARRAPQWAKR